MLPQAAARPASESLLQATWRADTHLHTCRPGRDGWARAAGPPPAAAAAAPARRPAAPAKRAWLVQFDSRAASAHAAQSAFPLCNTYKLHCVHLCMIGKDPPPAVARCRGSAPSARAACGPCSRCAVASQHAVDMVAGCRPSAAQSFNTAHRPGRSIGTCPQSCALDARGQ